MVLPSDSDYGANGCFNEIAYCKPIKETMAILLMSIYNY